MAANTLTFSDISTIETGYGFFKWKPVEYFFDLCTPEVPVMFSCFFFPGDICIIFLQEIPELLVNSEQWILSATCRINLWKSSISF